MKLLNQAFLSTPRLFGEQRLPNKITQLICIAVGLLGLAYLCHKTFFAHLPAGDFKYIWLAGSLWLDGATPYGDEYHTLGGQMFSGFNGHPFFYPPNWWIISSPLSLFEYDTARHVWIILNSLLAIVGGVVLFWGLGKGGVTIPGYMVFCYTGLVCLMQATANTLALGQSSILMYFAICVFIAGLLAKRLTLISIGLGILMLKPQLGLIFLALALPLRICRIPIIMASVATALLALPTLLLLGPLGFVEVYLKSLSLYGEFSVNNPQSTTGLRNLIYFFGSFSAGSLLVTALGAVIVGCLSLSIQRILANVKDEDSFGVILLSVLALLSSCIFASLHSYDTIVLAPVALLAFRFSLKLLLLAWLTLLVLVRSDNICEALAFYQEGAIYSYNGSLVTLLSLILFGAFLMEFVKSSQMARDEA